MKLNLLNIPHRYRQTWMLMGLLAITLALTGIQAYLANMSLRERVLTISKITAQNLSAVSRVVALSGEDVAAQIEAVLSGFPVRAVKTGMLYSEEILEVVARRAKCSGRAPRKDPEPTSGSPKARTAKTWGVSS